jgi:hypothetical protein
MRAILPQPLAQAQLTCSQMCPGGTRITVGARQPAL